MHVSQIEIDGSFKRFSGLKVTSLPPARFVILVGPNGSGKSSILDALLYWAQFRVGSRRRMTGGEADDEYYRHPDGTLASQIEVTFHDQPDKVTAAKNIHVRSAYRFTPIIRTSNIYLQPSLREQPSVSRMIDQDDTAHRHYQTLVGQFVRLLSDFSKDKEPELQDARQKLKPLAQATKELFPDLEFQSLGDGLKDGSFFFNKRSVKNFRYENLSSGEKAAFDLLLDLFISGQDFADGMICLDEPETHLNPRIQAGLLDSIDKLVPESCQVWIATHSAGMIRHALEIERKTPGRVIFLDFEDAKVGEHLELSPAITDRVFWQRAFRVALDDLASLLAPETIYLCEGSLDPEKSKDSYAWDAKIYKAIFQNKYPEIEFISVGGKGQLKPAQEMATVIAPGSKSLRLRDRDDLTDEAAIELMGTDADLRILSRRDLENYLVDNEILEKLVTEKGARNHETLRQLIAARDEGLKQSAKADDAKVAVGKVYDLAKTVLVDNGQLGENKLQFARYILAALITPDTKVFKELQKSLGLN